MELSYTEGKGPPRSHKFPIKKPSAKCGIIHFDFWLEVSQRPAKQYKLLLLLLVDGKTLLLKYHTLLSQDMENKICIDKSFPSCWLHFTVLEGAIEAAGCRSQGHQHLMGL